MRSVKKAKHGPPLPPLNIPQCDVDSEEGSEVEAEGEMEGLEDNDGSMSVEEECDPAAVKYIEQFKMEVIEDTGEKCDAKGLQMAKDLSAKAPQRFLGWVVSSIKVEKFQEEFWEHRPYEPCACMNHNKIEKVEAQEQQPFGRIICNKVKPSIPN